MKRRAWVAGVLLMLFLGVFTSKTSPPERPAPTFLTVTSPLAASGNTSPGRIRLDSNTTSFDAVTITLAFADAYPSIKVDVDTPSQPADNLPRTKVRVMAPPMWASDEVRGIRKKFRG